MDLQFANRELIINLDCHCEEPIEPSLRALRGNEVNLKQSFERERETDCFVVPPRNDVKKRQ